MKVIYKLILTCSTYTFSRPGVWVSPDNLLFLYRVMAELCSINKQHGANSLGSGSVNGNAGSDAGTLTMPLIMNGFEVNI